jgi:uncharacterized protein (TIGR03086 family)
MNGRTGLLERAIIYAARSLLDVTPALLPRPTPCRGWNLDMLLSHASESLAALHDGTLTRHIALIPAAPDRAPPVGPAQTFRDRAGRLLAAQATADGQRQALHIGDLPLSAIAMECAGAIEIAVHGWDISQACAQHRPIPDALAASLLAIAPLLIPETGRHPLFSPPVTPTAHASPGDRLIAYLGRNPSTSPPAPDHSLSTASEGHRAVARRTERRAATPTTHPSRADAYSVIRKLDDTRVRRRTVVGAAGEGGQVTAARHGGIGLPGRRRHRAE